MSQQTTRPTARDFNGHVPSVATLMTTPSTFLEPADPIPLRQKVLSVEEFNQLATSTRKPIEPHEDTARLIVGGVMYVVALSEVAC